MNTQPAFEHDRVLHDASCDGVTLAQALAVAFGDGVAVGLLTSAQSFGWLRYVGGRVEGPPGGDVQLAAHAYEARCFDANLELRWRRGTRGGDVGRAVVLTEHAARLPREWHETSRTENLAVLSNRYLIWGVAQSPSTDAWTRLANLPSAQSWLPVVAERADATYQLCTTEYFGGAGDDVFGNVAAIEERWTHLAVHEEEAS